jgi:hypothetical protein
LIVTAWALMMRTFERRIFLVLGRGPR